MNKELSNNEIMNTNKDPIELLQLSENIESGALSNLGASDWIPILTVAHYLSQSVDKGVAKAGEFVLGGQTSLGTEIKAVPLAFRLHVALFGPDNEFVENQYCMMGQRPSEAYNNLVKLIPPKKHTVSEGADMFLFLPDQNTFAQFFMKGQLAKDVQTVWLNGRGGRQIVMRTDKVQNKTGNKKWFRIFVNTTPSSVTIANVGNKDIAMDIVTYKKFLGQFSNPVTTAVETVSAEEVESIER